MVKSILFLFLGILFLFSCETVKKTAESEKKKLQDADKFSISGQVVEKDFIKKNGQSGGYSELYFRASIQDYFIKFCESSVTRKDLEPYVDKSITVHAEIVDGYWDICPNDPTEMQSRMGEYMLIKGIN